MPELSALDPMVTKSVLFIYADSGINQKEMGNKGRKLQVQGEQVRNYKLRVWFGPAV